MTARFEISIWADSFHEGNWACEGLAAIAKTRGALHTVEYLGGFQPQHTLSFAEFELVFLVFGSYRSWSEIPEKIDCLLSWGKPDFIGYDEGKEQILFAVEETAAVPTGNQALQRCERAYGSARSRIPFWYLLSEYGIHLDGGLRRDSPWPTIMALKLTEHFKTPNVVLHYSDEERPEDYSVGSGVNSLFSSLFDLTLAHIRPESANQMLNHSLVEQYSKMLAFVESQWTNVMDFLPGGDMLKEPSLANYYSGQATAEPMNLEFRDSGVLEWPITANLPPPIKQKQRARPLIKHDPLCYLMEQDVERGRAYFLSENAGSRPQSEDSLRQWIEEQSRIFKTSPVGDPPIRFTLSIEQFPASKTGRHLTTSRNILYLYDSSFHFWESLAQAFERLQSKSCPIVDYPLAVYVSNSMKPGRLFGDPYTGQIAAFATTFGKLGSNKRGLVAYFPHQVHGQALRKNISNKGVTIMTELTDFLIFHGGAVVSLSDKKLY